MMSDYPLFNFHRQRYRYSVHERILCLAAGAVKLFLCPSTLTGNSPYLHKRKPTHTHTGEN